MVEVVLTHAGVLVPKAHPQLAALVKRHLTVAPVSLNDPFPRKFKVYFETADAYVVPLHWARTALEPWKVTWRDARRDPDPAPALAFRGSLRADLCQPDAAAAVRASWANGGGGGGGALLCVPPGYGEKRATWPTVTRVEVPESI